jgi:integrating conjugative element relaxase (TIGR03760 family)
LFHRYGKKTKSSLKTKPLKDLTRIVQASALLAEEKRTVLLAQIRAANDLEEPRFDSLCLSLVHNLAQHCQSLPETANSYYSQQGGLIDHALNRTEAALSLFKQYVVKEGELSEEQRLWQYALFSAALLQGIGKLQTDFSLALYDNNGHFLKQWNPLLESLMAVGSYYSHEFLEEADEKFRRRVNLLLARLLMPAGGFSWIASNSDVLAVWLALLNEDLQGAGTLGAILVRANAIALQRYFNQFLIRHYGSRGGRYGRASTFAGGLPEPISEIEQQIGIEFLQWLNKALESGRLMLNKAPLFMVPGGLLMSADMFKLFIREHPEYKNWQAIQSGFLSLGLHRLGPGGSIYSRFEQANTQQMHSGVVFAEYAVVLPAKVEIHHLSTGKSHTMTAIEVIHEAQSTHNFTKQQASYTAHPLLHLNASGQWQHAVPSERANPKPGARSGA